MTDQPCWQLPSPCSREGSSWSSCVRPIFCRFYRAWYSLLTKDACAMAHHTNLESCCCGSHSSLCFCHRRETQKLPRSSLQIPCWKLMPEAGQECGHHRENSNSSRSRTTTTPQNGVPLNTRTFSPISASILGIGIKNVPSPVRGAYSNATPSLGRASSYRNINGFGISRM
jgi:hypothetical protein